MSSWLHKAGKNLIGIKMTPDYSMSLLTTFKIGGPVDLLVMPQNNQEVAKILKFCIEENVPWMIVGLGSNLIVRDKGIRGIVIKLEGDFLKWNIEGNLVVSGSAVTLADLAKGTAAQGLSGLEFACGIPGTVGGAVFMNAGAYEGEISQVLSEVVAYDADAGFIQYSGNEFDFGYRHSIFQHKSQVILEVKFTLREITSETALAKITELTCKRESKQPLDMPSAGSVFRRPEGHYVGPMIESAGLKGYSIGGAQVSEKHAGFIVNKGGATAQDVLDLIAHIQRVIRERNGVELIPEIKVVGEE